jgi:hypothetical protein
MIHSPTKAEVIFSNLGPADALGAPGGWIVGGPGTGADSRIASLFTTGSSAWTLESVELALDDGEGPNDFSLSVMTDQDGLPGELLSVVPFSGVPANPTLVTVSIPGSLQLDANATYWIALSSNDSSSCGWLPNLAQTGYAARYLSGPSFPPANWFEQDNGAPAMRVDGTAVPEPDCVAFLACSSLAAVRLRRCR